MLCFVGFFLYPAAVNCKLLDLCIPRTVRHISNEVYRQILQTEAINDNKKSNLADV